MGRYSKVWTGEPYERPRGKDGRRRYGLKWRLYLPDGQLSRSGLPYVERHRATFRNKTQARDYAKQLHSAAGNAVDPVTGLRWGWSGEEPVPLPADAQPVAASDDTVWRLICDWRKAKWPLMSGEGRSSAAYCLRAMCRVLTTTDGAVPEAADRYLQEVAFRNGATEPTRAELQARHGDDAEELWTGRRWLESHSLPLSSLDRNKLRDVLADFRANGQTAATERRYWTNVQSVMSWAADEGRAPVGIASRIGLRQVEPRVLDADEPVPTADEMWRFAFACGIAPTPRKHGDQVYWRWCALPLVMGGAGLRIGECRALLRRHCREHPNGGMWLDVRGNRAAPGKSWTDTGAYTEDRGTKRKGHSGNTRGRTTYLPPKEASILRLHLELFTGPAPDAPVFTTAGGARLNDHIDEQVWQPALRLAFPDADATGKPLPRHRLRDMGRHAFRHLAATRWLRNPKVSITTACAWGGWDRPATMLDFYAAVLPGDQEAAAAAMAAE